jgi:hypothetical protein
MVVETFDIARENATFTVKISTKQQVAAYL